MNMIFLKTTTFLMLAFTVLPVNAQTGQLTIEECFDLARNNYPLIKKQELISKTERYSLENAGRVYLPQFSVTGQATYQSETIKFPDVLAGAPGISLPEISKDQYRLQAEISQQIYDGGVTKNNKELIRANEEIHRQSLEVNLNTLKERVIQLYFSVLMMDEQLKQNEIRKTDLRGALNKASAALQNGTGLRSNVDELKAAIVNADMSAIEFSAHRKAYLDMLSLLTGRQIRESTQLVMPQSVSAVPEIKRPELKLFDLQKKSFAIQEKKLKSELTPKLGAFVQGAYGRPTLNIIENQFGAWWMGGLRLQWNLGSLYTLKNNKALLKINRENLDIDKEVFLFNTGISLSRQDADIKKFSELIEKDDEIISLRGSVVRSARAQLDNGVITVHEYITKLNDENLAKQARIVHNIQFLQAQYNYKNTSGN